MEKIDEQLNNLALIDVPVGLHHSVMSKINYQKIKLVLLFTFAFLTLNFIVVAWRINTKLIEAEFLDMTQDFLEVFSFNISFINTMFQNFFEIISPALFLSTVLSLVGAMYTIKKITFYQFNL